MDAFWLDFQYCLRRLLKTPGFTLVAVLTLVVGIGMNSAMFSVVNAVLLRPLPFEDSERLCMAWGRFPRLGYNELPASDPELMDIKQQAGFFDSAAGFVETDLTLTGRGDPLKLQVARVTADFFKVLRLKAALGRTFLDEEDRPGRNRVVLLSDSLWHEHFGAERDVIGQKITLDGESYVIVGVMPPGFRFPSRMEIWVPLGLDSAHLRNRGEHYIKVVGRLKPGITYERAGEEAKALAYRFEQTYPGSYPPQAAYTITLTPLRQQLVGNVRPAFLVLLGTVAFVLLIACTNVVNLLLVRAQVRGREISLRMVLGSSRWGLVRQFLIESLILTTAGGALGLLAAHWAVRLLVAINRENIPRSQAIGIDGRVLAFTAVLVLLTGVSLALIVAWRALKVDLQESLKSGSHQSTASAGQQTTRSLLVVAEVSAALVLLIGAGLMINSFQKLQRVDLGFNDQDLFTVRLSLLNSAYPGLPQKVGFYSSLLDRVRHLPGVQAAALVEVPPFGGGATTSIFAIEGKPFSHDTDEIPPIATLLSVSDSYFDTMKIPMVKGRPFSPLDYSGSSPVVIIDQVAANRHWQNEDPVGRRLKLGGPLTPTPWVTVVGVVGQIKDSRLEAEDQEHLYFPFTQRPGTESTLVLRTQGNPLALLPGVRSQVKALDPAAPLYDPQTMESRVADALSNQRLSTVLLSLFAGTALVLAAIGLYGVVAYGVAQRTNEIGIRMALGAQAGQVFQMVISHGLGLTLIGVAVGAAAALLMSRVLSSLLFGVSSNDPTTFMLAVAVLVAVTLLASYFPARRATRVVPSAALRGE